MVDQPVTQKMYALDLYPDTNRVSAAAPILVAPSQDVESIDFHLTTTTVAPLRGRVVMPEGAPDNSNVQVSVFPEDAPDPNYENWGNAAAQSDRTFEFPYLIAGPYQVVAEHFSVEGLEYRAAERIELPPSGQEISLRLERGIELSGRVDIEGPGDRPAGPYRVTLVSGDSPPVRSLPTTETVKPDGTFTIANIFRGSGILMSNRFRATAISRQ